MDGNSTVAIAALTLAGTIATGFFAMINKQNKVHDKMTKAMNNMAKSNEKIATETKRGNDQSEQRNGHLADLVAETSKATLEAVQIVKEQVVEHQEVKQAILKKAIIKDNK